MDYVVVLDSKIVYLVRDHEFARLIFNDAETAKEFVTFIEDKIKSDPK